MDPNILKETSQEVHDEYLKQLNSLPAFNQNEKSQKGSVKPPAGLSHVTTRELTRKEQEVDLSDVNKKNDQNFANPPPDQKQEQSKHAEESPAPPPSKPDKPENDTETDNTKIDQILAKVKNSVAEKVDIPGIEDGKSTVTFIEATLLVPGIDGYLIASDGSVHALTHDLSIVNLGSLKTLGPQSIKKDDHILKCLHWGDFQIVLAEQSGLTIYKDLTTRLWSNAGLKPRVYSLEGSIE